MEFHYHHIFITIFFSFHNNFGLLKKFFGLWTVCLHPDTMSHNEIEKLGKQIENYVKADKIISLRDINLFKNRLLFLIKFYHLYFGKNTISNYCLIL